MLNTLRKRLSPLKVQGSTLPCLFSVLFISMAATAKQPDENINVAAFSMPKESAYWSDETKAGMAKQQQMMDKAYAICVPWHFKTGAEIRDCEQRMYPIIMNEAKKIYDVTIKPNIIAGIHTDIVTPKTGISDKNKKRVIINLHGGAFKYGSRFGGQLEAMPIAALGKYKVVAVDYSKAPEHIFPQAVKDVVAVYKALLKQYKPQQIAIYGCSAGSRLTGEVIAWLKDKSLPQPAAIGLLCSPPTGLDGDSNYYAAAIKGQQPLTIDAVEYWQGVNADNKLAFPGEHKEMLAAFPPSILMTSTRDYSLSPMVAMHQKLIALNKESELHIFEGFGHAGFLSMFTPEAKQAAKLLSNFFDQHLAQ